MITSALQLMRLVAVRCGKFLPALIALAALANASHGMATVIYDSGGFESPKFLNTQSLAGQDPTPPPLGYGPWHQDLGASTAVVQTDTPNGGTQSIKMTRVAGSTGDTRWGINVPITPTAASNVVAIDFDMNVTISPGTNWNGPELGPLFGVECYDTSGVSPKLIGSLFLDAYAGDVVYQQATNGALKNSGRFIPRNEYHHYTLSANFSLKTYSIAVDGAVIHTENFVDSSAAAFNDAPLAVLSATTNSAASTGTAFFDNYTISVTSSRLNYLVWQGDGVTNLWDMNTSSNWFNGDGLAVFSNNVPAVFDDTGTNTPAIAVQGTVQPASISVNASQDYAFGGPGSIGGSGNLTKRGSGALTLTGNNSFSGGIIVSNGTLSVNNTTGSGTGTGPITVAAGAALGGTGALAGSVTVASGGILNPGNNTGTLTINNNLDLNGSAVLNVALGSSSSHLIVSSNLTLSGALNVSDAGGFATGTYTLINYGGALSGPGLFLASAPAGYDCSIDTNTAGQVKLIVSTPPLPPDAPSGLSATAVNESQINLAWVDNSSNETAFLIERSANNFSFTQIASVPANTTSYSDTSLNPSSAYYYRVRASNSGGYSAYSSVVSATTLVSTEPPVAYYQFEFNTLDSSGNNNNGAPVGGLLYSAGKVGTYCAQFDGTSSWIEILPVARTNFTVAMWVQTTNTGTGSTWYNGMGLVDGEVTGNQADWGCSILNSKFAVGIGSPDTTFSTGVSVNDGNWHYLVATRDSASGLVKLYVDGALNGIGVGPTGPRTAPNDLRIGATHSAVPTVLKGNIDDLRIYDRILTDQEIAMLAGRTARIASIHTDGSDAVVSSESGPPHGTYYVLSCTNLTVPIPQWSVEATNQFDDSGNCVFTNAMSPSQPAKFYMLQLP